MNRSPVTRLAIVALLAAPALARETSHPIALPFIENDFDAAVSQAKTASRPVFVEVWAPW